MATKASRTTTTIHLSDLKPDPTNARVHTPRNVGMIVDALQEVGAARSIVIDEDNVVLAGNGVVDGAGQIDMTAVTVVEADGTGIVAVRRRGLTDEQKRRLALFDNRAAEMAEWDAEALAALKSDGALEGLFTKDELEKLLGPLPPEAFPSVGEDIETNTVCPKCGYEWAEAKK